MRARDYRLLHADCRRPARFRTDRGDQRDQRHLCDGWHADSGARYPRHAARQAAGRDRTRHSGGRRGGLRRCRHSRCRRTFDRYRRADLRPRRDRHRPPRADPPQRRGAAGRRLDPDQGDRRRDLRQRPAQRCVGRGGLRRDARFDDAVEPRRRDPRHRNRGPRDDRYHRFRPARPWARDGPREPGDFAHRRGVSAAASATPGAGCRTAL